LFTKVRGRSVLGNWRDIKPKAFSLNLLLEYL
jgi:hypothetical protein